MTNKPEPNTRPGGSLKPCPFCQGEAEWRDDPGTCDVPFGLVVNHAKGCFLQLPHQDCDGIVERWNTRPLTQPSELVERPSEAIEVLAGPYRQLDMDGVIVGVSRQAIDETLAYLTQLEAQIAKLQADGDKLAEALGQAVQLAEVASDWNLSEVEIDGEMVGIYALQASFRQALTEWKDRA